MLEALDLDHISVSDKFLMIEELWTSISNNSTASELTPQWHLDVLNERDKKLASGDAEFLDFESVKEQLRKEYLDNYGS